MPRLKVTIGTDGAAFEIPNHEAGRILRELADTLEQSEPGSYFSKASRGVVWGLMDLNGNRCGSWQVTRR